MGIPEGNQELYNYIVEKASEVPYRAVRKSTKESLSCYIALQQYKSGNLAAQCESLSGFATEAGVLWMYANYLDKNCTKAELEEQAKYFKNPDEN